MVRAERWVRATLKESGLVIVACWRTPHMRFRCVNAQGVEVTYTHPCSASDQRALANGRSIIRKLAQLTAPQAGARL